jgi:hypothetical protein
MSARRSSGQGMTFEEFRRRVLKSLKNKDEYRNFSGTVAAFHRAGGLDQFAKDLFPMFKACWQQGFTIEHTAYRLDKLTEMVKMRAALYMVEVKTGNEGQDV